MQPSHKYFVLCTQRLPRYGVTFAHVLTYLPTRTAHSKMVGKEEEQHAVLQYSGMPIIKELEALLVWNCSKRLEEYGLILWVVSIVLYIQESQPWDLQKFLCLCVCLPCHVAV